MDPWQKQNAGSRKRLVADSNSVVTDRKIQNIKGKNFTMKAETVCDPRSSPSGNPSGEDGQADCSARGGSMICTDDISNVEVDGNIDLSVTVKLESRQDEASSQGPSVETIIHHKLELVECLRADRSFILQHVHAKRIVTDRQYQKLKHISQPEEGVNELIDQVIVRGQESCSLFLELLKEPGILQTYPQLKPITEKW